MRTFFLLSIQFKLRSSIFIDYFPSCFFYSIFFYVYSSWWKKEKKRRVHARHREKLFGFKVEGTWRSRLWRVPPLVWLDDPIRLLFLLAVFSQDPLLQYIPNFISFINKILSRLSCYFRVAYIIIIRHWKIKKTFFF